jgi:ATP-dependent Lhr-like helicase
LYRGEKRLVFCDSRSRVEQLAAGLRTRGVATYVAHSSLGPEERREAERAFAGGRDCVIVATSALELGIDVGDLDRVIQVDAPATVSSFLQRMGRTGRRPDTARNCLFLATSDDALLRAAGLVELSRSGYVESAVPPPAPLHILAQQILALALQERGIGRAEWPSWVDAVPAFRELDRGVVGRIVGGMLDRGLLWDEGGVLWLGREGQDAYGRRNFLDLVSVFTAPPMFTVLHARHELGSVHESTFLGRRNDEPPVLLLAGRSWRVTHLDWRRRKAFVEPAEDEGRSRWRGEGQHLGRDLCGTIRRLLGGEAVAPCWSRRAVLRMGMIRGEYSWLAGHNANVLLSCSGEVAWWTFAGGRANAALAFRLSRDLDLRVSSDNFAVRFPPQQGLDLAEEAVRGLRGSDPAGIEPPVNGQALDGLKFAECLPEDLAAGVLQARLSDALGVAEVLGRFTRTIIAD